MATAPKVLTLEELLDTSNATPEFKEAVHSLSHGESQERIEYNWGAPSVKVMRTIKKLLEACPHEAIERVHIKGAAGCSNFTGTLNYEPGGVQIEFDWDCRWQAEEQGWKDFFGEPDQIRAAHTLDYQCFRIFNSVSPATKH